MKFKSGQVFEMKTLDDLYKEAGNLDGKGREKKHQWIYRAMGKWPNDSDKTSQGGASAKESGEKVTNISITSSFDDAWKSTSKIRSTADRWRYESWMLMDFKREAHHYQTNLPKPEDFLGWMALARHYKMPSRLVDFTYSIYVAAYFALSKRGRYTDKNGELKDEDGCILAVNLNWLKKVAEKEIRDSFHEPKVFREYAFKSKKKLVFPVNPLRRNVRLARQQGLFLCPSRIKYTFEENLQAMIDGQANEKPDKLIRAIRLPAKIRSEALRDLDRMNIGLHTLYWDLAGWAESRRDLVHKDITDERFKKELERAIGPDPLI